MRKIAILAVCIGALGLLGCGGGSGDDDIDSGISFIDAADQIDAAGAACNPVAQTGCQPTEKCTWIIDQAEPTLLAYTGCAPNGDKEANAECTKPETGYDDCVKGQICLSGTCAEICNVTARGQGTCDAGYACGLYNSLFSDMGDNVGVCDFLCDPVLQDCPMTGKACYLNAIEGESTCSPLIVDETFTQDEDCYDLAGVGHCWLNGCSMGFGANVPDDTCAFFCRPVNNYKDDYPALAGDPDVMACDAEPEGRPAGPGPSYECRFIQAYWGNTTGTPETIGMCVDPASNYGTTTRGGTCKDFDLVQLVTDADGGTTIDTAYCTANPNNCLFDCVSNDFLNNFAPSLRAKYGPFMDEWVRGRFEQHEAR